MTAVSSWGRRAGAVAVALATATTCLGGCGLGGESSPKPLDPKSVPYGLLSRSGPPRASGPGADVVKVTMYLEGRNQHLVRAYRHVGWPASVAAVLEALALGPTRDQSNQGLVSPASSVGPFSAGPVRGGVVSIDLPASFKNLGGEDQTLAAAQIVFSVTNLPGINGVSFIMGGQRVHVPNDVGKLVRGPLTRRDYAALAN